IGCADVTEKFSVVENQKSCCVPPSCSHKRGASRSSRAWKAGCDGRDGVSAQSLCGRLISLRTAKSCGPGIPTLMPSWRDDDLADDGGKKARSPVRSPRSTTPLKPLRGECRLIWLNPW